MEENGKTPAVGAAALEGFGGGVNNGRRKKRGKKFTRAIDVDLNHFSFSHIVLSRPKLEFSQAKARLLLQHQAAMDALKDKHAQELWDLQRQLDGARETQNVCENTIASKDRLIESLTASVGSEVRGSKIMQTRNWGHY